MLSKVIVLLLLNAKVTINTVRCLGRLGIIYSYISTYNRKRKSILVKEELNRHKFIKFVKFNREVKDLLTELDDIFTNWNIKNHVSFHPYFR